MSKRVVFVLLLVLLICSQLRTNAQAFTPLRVGVLGDSATDEYRADDNRGGSFAAVTRNWLEQLQLADILRPGAWSSVTRGEPRRKGYLFNFARSAAKAADLVNQGQISGLTSEMIAALNTANKRDVVVIWVGANDIAPYTSPTTYNAIYNGTLVGQALTDWLNSNITSYIAQAANAVRAVDPGVMLVIATIPDVNNSPAVAGNPAYSDPLKRANVTAAINLVNQQIEGVILTHGAAKLDAAVIMTRILSRVNPQTGVMVIDPGGYNFNLNAFGVGNDPVNGILGDAIHSGTILNCITANEVVDALNIHYSIGLPRVSEAQCLVNAGKATPTPTATPTATPTTAQTAVPTTVSTFTPMPSNTPTVSPSATSVPTNTDVPTATNTSAPPTSIPPTLAPTFTMTPPPCSASNAGLTVNAIYSVAFSQSIEWVGRLRNVGAPELADTYAGAVAFANKSVSLTPVTVGLLAITIWFTDDTALELCFSVS